MAKQISNNFDNGIQKEVNVPVVKKQTKWQWIKNGLSWKALKTNLRTYFQSKAMRYIYMGSAAVMVGLIVFDFFHRNDDKAAKNSSKGDSSSNGNDLASESIYDEKTGVTYYLDPESGYYYYFDESTNSYQWY